MSSFSNSSQEFSLFSSALCFSANELQGVGDAGLYRLRTSFGAGGNAPLASVLDDTELDGEDNVAFLIGRDDTGSVGMIGAIDDSPVTVDLEAVVDVDDRRVLPLDRLDAKLSGERTIMGPSNEEGGANGA